MLHCGRLYGRPVRTVFAIDVDGVPECLRGALLPRSCNFCDPIRCFSAIHLFWASAALLSGLSTCSFAFLGTLQCALVSGHVFALQAHAQRPFALCVAGASSVTLSSCLLSSGNATGADVGLLRLVANISMTLESLVEGPLIPSPWGITPALGIEGNESSYYRKRAC